MKAASIGNGFNRVKQPGQRGRKAKYFNPIPWLLTGTLDEGIALDVTDEVLPILDNQKALDAKVTDYRRNVSRANGHALTDSGGYSTAGVEDLVSWCEDADGNVLDADELDELDEGTDYTIRYGIGIRSGFPVSDVEDEDDQDVEDDAEDE